ncbi:baseplate J/gp47 family protein [Aliiroseovarius crassostreae]|uniref:baseplate assembly protein n=1 Tax=Aliiroseovarius crassostreae TaxID=154981 RepID=UPI00220EDE86|nr:baseplate J/gp47 family protein [Aliiroseovarius crassostreae]UWQ00855.1 baseplate J/gp47 family protein [Aliiroseovarius crassostreae]
MSGFTSIDLSKLPAPEVIKTPEYEALLAEMKATAVEFMPDLASFLELESEPATKILRVCAYHRALDRLEFNDGARANMLALSSGADLENLSALWGVGRLVMQAADASVDPPIPEIKESDEAFRARVQLSLEGRSTAGPRGAYLFWTLSASGQVKDAHVANDGNGQIFVTVLSHEGDGTPSEVLLNTVQTALNKEDIRPLSDTVFVQAPSVLTYEVEAELTLYEGPGEAQVLEAAEEVLERYIQDHHRLGHDITISGLHAVLHQPGVQKVTLTKPAQDVVVAANEVAYCTSDAIAVLIGGRDV